MRQKSGTATSSVSRNLGNLPNFSDAVKAQTRIEENFHSFLRHNLQEKLPFSKLKFQSKIDLKFIGFHALQLRLNFGYKKNFFEGLLKENYFGSDGFWWSAINLHKISEPRGKSS